MVRNKSVSLFGSLNLDHFIWSFGEAVSAEYCLLFFRAVSGFRRWFAVGTLIQMLTCQYTQEQSFLGGKITKDFHFSPTQRFGDDINSMLFYPSVIAQGSVLYFMGNLVAGDILSSGFSTCCLIYD